MAKIHFLCTALVNGVSKTTYELMEGERVELFLLEENREPISTSLYYKEGIPFSKGCVIIKGEKAFYLKREKRIDRIWQESFDIEGEEVLVTLYRDSSAVLCVDFRESFLNYPIGLNITEARITCDNFCNNILLFAKIDEKTRVVVVNLLSLKVILDIVCDEYSYDESLAYTICYKDIVNRRKRVKVGFNDEGIIPIDEVFECESVHLNTQTQIKLAFLQGMSAEDYDYAKNLLSEELKENFGEIQVFLGNADEVIPLNDNEYLYGDKIVTFECNNDIIVDISVSE